jgi:hypothetical protein
MKLMAYSLLLSFTMFAAAAFCAESASLQKAKKEADAEREKLNTTVLQQI